MPSQINTWGAAQGSLLGGFGVGILCTGIYFIGKAAGASYIPRDPAALGSEVLAPFMPLVISSTAAVVAFVVRDAVFNGREKVGSRRILNHQ